MSALEQIALAGQALRLTLRRLGEGPLWVPWVAFAALQLAVLGALLGFAHPLLSWAVAPLVRAGGGEAALHYPGFFQALPGLLRRTDLLLAAGPGALAAGWSTWLFAGRWRDLDAAPGEGWAEAASRGGSLVLALLPFPLLALGGAALIARGVADAPGLVRRLGDLAVLGVAVLAQALALFVPALVMLERRGAARAWTALPRTWARGLWAALPLALAAALARLPLEQLQEAAAAPEAAGAPERTAWLAGAGVLVALVISFLLAGSATAVYLGVVAPAEDGA